LTRFLLSSRLEFADEEAAAATTFMMSCMELVLVDDAARGLRFRADRSKAAWYSDGGPSARFSGVAAADKLAFVPAMFPFPAPFRPDILYLGSSLNISLSESTYVSHSSKIGTVGTYILR
jgi:hypothetical protein